MIQVPTNPISHWEKAAQWDQRNRSRLSKSGAEQAAQSITLLHNWHIFIRLFSNLFFTFFVEAAHIFSLHLKHLQCLFKWMNETSVLCGDKVNIRDRINRLHWHVGFCGSSIPSHPSFVIYMYGPFSTTVQHVSFQLWHVSTVTYSVTNTATLNVNHIHMTTETEVNHGLPNSSLLKITTITHTVTNTNDHTLLILLRAMCLRCITQTILLIFQNRKYNTQDGH